MEQENTDWLAKKFDEKKQDYNRRKHNDSSNNNNSNEWSKYFNCNNLDISEKVSDDGTSEDIPESILVKNDDGKNNKLDKQEQDCEPEELYDVQKYLPQEVNDYLFEVMPKPIANRNTSLGIRVVKPIGIKNISNNDHKSYDIKTTATPKFVVSPWLQSNIEPDTNLKPLY